MGWPWDAFEGQRVVAIGGRYGGTCSPEEHMQANLPVHDMVYTIRAINVWPARTIILLREIDNSHFNHPIEPGFDIRAFRPVDPSYKKADRVLAAIKPDLLNAKPVRKPEREGV